MFFQYKTFSKSEEKPYIDRQVIDRADLIESDTILRDEESKEIMEEYHLTELDVRIKNLDKREMIRVMCVAVRKYPFAYLQVLAEWILEELIKKRRV